MEEPTVGDMSITDEHAIIPMKSTFQEVAHKLQEFPTGAILIHDDKTNNIGGIVTIRELLHICSEGKNPAKIKVKDHMKTEIMQLPRGTPLSETLAALRQHHPDAVVIREPDGGFAGYFSPDDYKEAVRKIEAHRTLIAQLEKTQAALKAGKKPSDAKEESEDDDLLSIMLGDSDDEDEEEESDSMNFKL